jgi:signal peptidase II
LTASRAWLRAGVVFVVVLAADQISKVIVRGNIQPGERHQVLPGVHLVRVGNEGLAFGLLNGSSTWLATGLLLGGAAGNIIDRVSHGAVTDWIKLPHWPAFNVADVAITAGVIALVFAIDAPKDR